jgi:hypothetical protein
MLEKSKGAILTEPLNAADLLQLGFEDDPLLLEDPSLCTLCSFTCNGNTAATQ